MNINDPFDLIFLATIITMLVVVISTAVYYRVKNFTKSNQVREVTIILYVNLFLLLLMLYTAWPMTAWGQAQELQTANDFMNYLKMGDYDSVEKLIGGRYNDHSPKETVLASLRNPENRPVAWQLELTASYAAKGTVILDDGREFPITIYIEWRGEIASWKITGVLYDSFNREQDSIWFVLYPRNSFNDIIMNTALSVGFISLLWVFSLFRRKPNATES